MKISNGLERVAILTMDNSIKVWDLETKSLISEIKIGKLEVNSTESEPDALSFYLYFCCVLNFEKDLSDNL